MKFIDSKKQFTKVQNILCVLLKLCIDGKHSVGINRCVGVVKPSLSVGSWKLAFGRGGGEWVAVPPLKRATAQVFPIDNSYGILPKSLQVVFWRLQSVLAASPVGGQQTRTEKKGTFCGHKNPIFARFTLPLRRNEARRWQRKIYVWRERKLWYSPKARQT